MKWRHQEYRYEIEYQRQTAEKDNLLRHFFELPLFGMVITHSHTGRWIRFNRHFCSLLGYNHEELNHHTLNSLLQPDDALTSTRLINDMEQGVSDGYQCEKRFIHKDGHLIYTNVDTRCVRTDDHKISFIISVIEDISLRKMRENELQKKTIFTICYQEPIKLLFTAITPQPYSSKYVRQPLKMVVFHSL
jgi:PAS domain S-box-containing protein